MKRHLLIIGVADYQLGWGVIREAVEAEVEKTRLLFLDLLKFEPSTFTRVSSTNQTAIKDQLVDWREKVHTIPDATSSDLLVVYYTGHGVVENSIYYLITSDIRADRPSTAMQLPNLIPLIWTGERHVLLILDTCQSGAGASEALSLIDRLREAAGGAARDHELHIISTARSIENARAKSFVDGLDHVIRSGNVGSSDDEFLRPDGIMSQVNAILASWYASDNPQHAKLSGGWEGAFEFFPNPRWEPHLRVNASANETQRVIECIRARAMHSHWEPRARGVAHDSEPGWLFTGRAKAARALASWLGSASGQRGLIVTGPPGSGKSALLARMVTLSHPDARERAQKAGALEGVLPEELPTVDSLRSAVHARAKTSGEIALEFAVALNSNLGSGETDPEALARSAAISWKTPTTLLVDALDEAQNPEQVAAFLRSIVDRAKAIKIVVGLRGEEGMPNRLTDRLGPRFATCDLGTKEYLDVEDIRRYVERCLLESTFSPYSKPAHQVYAAVVARAVAARAGRSFLVASQTARSLVVRSNVISVTELDELPSAAGEAFEFDLKLLSDSERNEAVAIFGALAFAQGRGLPRTLWVPFATAVGNSPLSERDIERWLDRSGFYVTHEQELGSQVVRLYHEEFARFLRKKLITAARGDEGDGQDVEGMLVETLTSTVPTDQASGEWNWTEASPYIQRYLPRHLKAAGRSSALYNLLFDKHWILAKSKMGDFTPLLDDLDLAIQVAQEENPINVSVIARCCLAYSRYMTTAPPRIVDVLATAGQLDRAALIADNITYPLDRCQAFCFLAERNAQTHPKRAQEQLREARQSARAVVGSYGAMTHYWVVRAAIALDDPETAKAVAREELYRVQGTVKQYLAESSQHRWGPYHALFWTSMILRELEDQTGLEEIRRLLVSCKSPYNGGLNLELQTAGVTGFTTYLDSFLPWRGGQLPDGPGGILSGNLALALATAGQVDDANRILDETRSNWEPINDNLSDSAKRLAWALALCGRLQESLAHIASIPHPEERLRALSRVTEVLIGHGKKAELTVVSDLAERFLVEEEQELQRIQKKARPTDRWRIFTPNDFWRLRSWTAWILGCSGRMERALELVESVCTEEITPGEDTSLAQPTRLSEMQKHHVTTEVEPDQDSLAQDKVIKFLSENKFDEAMQAVDGISSAKYKVDVLKTLAMSTENKQRKLALLVSAMYYARRVGQSKVIAVIDRIKQQLKGSSWVTSLEESLPLSTKTAATVEPSRKY